MQGYSDAGVAPAVAAAAGAEASNCFQNAAAIASKFILLCYGHTCWVNDRDTAFR
jgi:hypothetical protein